MPDKYGDMTQEEGREWYKRRKDAEEFVNKREEEWSESWRLLNEAKNILKSVDNEVVENRLKALENLKRRKNG